jgi:GlpG protein
MIGQLQSEPTARTFSDYLYVLGIENQIEAEKDGGWGIWILADDELDRATELLSGFRANPADPKVLKAGQEAKRRRERDEQLRTAYQKRFHNRHSVFPSLTGYGVGPVTLSLIAISLIVYVISGFSTDMQRVHWLQISDYTVLGGPWDRLEGLPEIRHGQIWRLITPIFLHFSLMHIFFNLWWLLDLGAMIEARQGNFYLLGLVLAIAGVSNLAQYLVSGPGFGGMSGIVYGLLGYIWIRGKFDPSSGLYLHPTTVTMMIIWFFICFTNIMPMQIANTVHAVGLGMGMGWGYLSSLGRTYV